MSWWLSDLLNLIFAFCFPLFIVAAVEVLDPLRPVPVMARRLVPYDNQGQVKPVELPQIPAQWRPIPQSDVDDLLHNGRIVSMDI